MTRPSRDRPRPARASSAFANHPPASCPTSRQREPYARWRCSPFRRPHLGSRPPWAFTTAPRRLLHTLEDEGYLQRGHGTYRQRGTYSVTPRLLALAGPLAVRLPLVVGGERAVRHLHEATGLDAYLVIPSYGDVIVLARAGDRAPTRWSLLPATNSAGPIG